MCFTIIALYRKKGKLFGFSIITMLFNNDDLAAYRTFQIEIFVRNCIVLLLGINSKLKQSHFLSGFNLRICLSSLTEMFLN